MKSEDVPHAEHIRGRAYSVAWKNLHGKGRGVGRDQYSKADADALVKELNEQFKGRILHWAFPV